MVIVSSNEASYDFALSNGCGDARLEIALVE
jgi:hypothetical protein